MELNRTSQRNFKPEEDEESSNDKSLPSNPSVSSTKPVCVVKPFRVEEKPKTPQRQQQQQASTSSSSSWFFDNAWKIAAGVAAATVAIGAVVAMSGNKKNDDEDSGDD